MVVIERLFSAGAVRWSKPWRAAFIVALFRRLGWFNQFTLFSALLFQIMQAGRCPTDELSLTNCAVINEKDPQFEQWVLSCRTRVCLCGMDVCVMHDDSSVCSPHCRHVTVRNLAHKYVFTLKTHPSVNSGTIAFSLPQVGVSRTSHPPPHVLSLVVALHRW